MISKHYTAIACATVMIVVAGGCSTEHNQTSENMYCGFAEIRSETRVNIWSESVSETAVKGTCVTLHHGKTERYRQGEKVCVAKRDIQQACSPDPGVICAAECDGRYVQQ